MDIMILNLPRNINRYQITEMFKAYGKVDKCNLVMDKERDMSKGFAFITMYNDDEGQAAIDALHNIKVGSKRIRVKISEKREKPEHIQKDDSASE